MPEILISDTPIKEKINHTEITEDIEYPCSDGKPMADNDIQRETMIYAIDGLKWHFRHQATVYVSGDLLIYYEEGNPKKSIAPDVFVAFDVPKQRRYTYKLWEEGKGPDVVIEVLSPQTWRKDVTRNPPIYRRLGVKEYFLYDPLAEFIQPALQGYWLDDTGEYQPLRVDSLPEGGLKLDSHLLGLELHVDPAGRLRLFNPRTGAYLSTYEEEAQARQEAEAQRHAEAQARQELEQKLQEAEAKLRQAGLL